MHSRECAHGDLVFYNRAHWSQHINLTEDTKCISTYMFSFKFSPWVVSQVWFLRAEVLRRPGMTSIWTITLDKKVNKMFISIKYGLPFTFFKWACLREGELLLCAMTQHRPRHSAWRSDSSLPLQSNSWKREVSVTVADIYQVKVINMVVTSSI